MWLRDFLPYEISDARIMTFGYNGYTGLKNQFASQTLNGHATDMLVKLTFRRLGNNAVSSLVAYLTDLSMLSKLMETETTYYFHRT